MMLHAFLSRHMMPHDQPEAALVSPSSWALHSKYSFSFLSNTRISLRGGFVTIPWRRLMYDRVQELHHHISVVFTVQEVSSSKDLTSRYYDGISVLYQLDAHIFFGSNSIFFRSAELHNYVPLPPIIELNL